LQQHKNLDEDKATNHRKKRILFVDDDADTTAVICMGLSRHGFEVEAFVDSKLALHNFKPGLYDLLLLDVLMKGLDGFKLYDKMRKIDEIYGYALHQHQICFTGNTRINILKFRRNVSYKNHLPLGSSLIQ
jgi:CheY-like chemotaxis protein